VYVDKIHEFPAFSNVTRHSRTPCDLGLRPQYTFTSILP